MIQELEDTKLLKDYASKYTINDLTSEDIIKLMTTPYTVDEITSTFNISVEDFNEIRKKKGVTNIILEDTIRNVEAILAYIDDQHIFIGENIKKKIVNDLINNFLASTPKKNFYIQTISEISFTREKILRDIVNKNIDIDYRINKLHNTIPYIKEQIEILKKEEKNYLLDYNDQKLYKKLSEEKENGKVFKKEDLTRDILFELAVIENIPDSLVGDIYNLTKNQVRYLRTKYDLICKFETKLEYYPEMIIYGLEDNNMKSEILSNYQYEKIIKNIINKYYSKKTNNNIDNLNNEITISVDGVDETYYINFSDEKYKTSTKSNSRKHNGAHHNYKKENETKISHGKRG